MHPRLDVVLAAAFVAVLAPSARAQTQLQARPALRAPVRIVLKPQVAATRLTSAQLVSRIQVMAGGQAALATARVTPAGAANSGMAADGWPTTFAVTANANQLSSSQPAGPHSVSMQFEHFGATIAPDASGSFTVTLDTQMSMTPATELSLGALPAGWFAVAFQLRNVAGGTTFNVMQGTLGAGAFSSPIWGGTCSAADLAADSNGLAMCVVTLHLTQPAGGMTIIGGVSSGSADLLGATISRIGM